MLRAALKQAAFFVFILYDIISMKIKGKAKKILENKLNKKFYKNQLTRVKKCNTITLSTERTFGTSVRNSCSIVNADDMHIYFKRKDI